LIRRLQANGTPIHTSTTNEMTKLLAAENERTKLIEALNMK
jgi:hypothetical protein